MLRDTLVYPRPIDGSALRPSVPGRDGAADGASGGRHADGEATAPPVRQHATGTNVLRPFAHLLTGSVLSAGDGSPDLPALLADTAASVTVLADGAAHARAIADACRDLAHLRARPIDGLADAERFDAVVLIDPARSAWGAATEPGPDRLGHLIATARARLRPGGTLLVGVENAASLSHLSGGAEIPAVPGLLSLEARTRPDGVTLPTRRSLRDLLRGLGLAHQAWWFPFPALRWPLTLIAERGVAGDAGFDAGALAAAAAPFDPDRPPTTRISLQRAWGPVALAGLAGDLAPAFVVAASDAPLPPDTRLAVHLGHRRRPAFEKCVTFAATPAGILVTRTPLYPDRGAARPEARVGAVTNRFPDEPFVPGPSWQASLQAILARDGWTVAEIAAWAAVWRDAVRDLHAEGRDLDLDTRLPGEAIDAIPRNLLHHAGRPVFIDAEWDLGAPLAFGHLMTRALINALTDVEACAAPEASVEPTLLVLVREIARALGLPLGDDALSGYLLRESRFQSAVSGIETHRTLAWMAATRIGVPPLPADPLAERDREIARLRAENAALCRDGARQTEAVRDAHRRTDRVIAYAADLERVRGHLEDAVAGALRARADVPTDLQDASSATPHAAFHARLRRLGTRLLRS